MGKLASIVLACVSVRLRQPLFYVARKSVDRNGNTKNKNCISRSANENTTRRKILELRRLKVVLLKTRSASCYCSSIIKASDAPTFPEVKKIHIPQFHYNHNVNRWS